MRDEGIHDWWTGKSRLNLFKGTSVAFTGTEQEK